MHRNRVVSYNLHDKHWIDNSKAQQVSCLIVIYNQQQLIHLCLYQSKYHLRPQLR